MLYNEIAGKHRVYGSIIFCLLKSKYKVLCIFDMLIVGFQDDVCVCGI